MARVSSFSRRRWWVLLGLFPTLVSSKNRRDVSCSTCVNFLLNLWRSWILVAADVFFTDFLLPKLVSKLMGFLVIVKPVGTGTER